MTTDIYVHVEYDIVKDLFKVDSNTREPKDIIMNFIRIQMGAGKDNTPANIQDIYNIKVHLDLSEDIFTCTYDCGNKELREGILMRYVES
jgi:hypothetical protein